jgi:CRP-like cAMP-binding protein
MIIQNTDLFRELSQQAIAEIAKLAIKESHGKGTVLYTQKDPAKYFYSLAEGAVRLTMAKEGEIDYTVSKAGEVFGWSSMGDRVYYTANAVCVMPTKVAKIQKDELNKVFDKYPRDAAIFFKRLAGDVVQRLIGNYNAFLSEGSLKGVTYGSGQVMGGSEE